MSGWQFIPQEPVTVVDSRVKQQAGATCRKFTGKCFGWSIFRAFGGHFLGQKFVGVSGDSSCGEDCY